MSTTIKYLFEVNGQTIVGFESDQRFDGKYVWVVYVTKTSARQLVGELQLQSSVNYKMIANYDEEPLTWEKLLKYGNMLLSHLGVKKILDVTENFAQGPVNFKWTPESLIFMVNETALEKFTTQHKSSLSYKIIVTAEYNALPASEAVAPPSRQAVASPAAASSKAVLPPAAFSMQAVSPPSMQAVAPPEASSSKPDSQGSEDQVMLPPPPPPPQVRPLLSVFDGVNALPQDTLHVTGSTTASCVSAMSCDSSQKLDNPVSVTTIPKNLQALTDDIWELFSGGLQFCDSSSTMFKNGDLSDSSESGREQCGEPQAKRAAVPTKMSPKSIALQMMKNEEMSTTANHHKCSLKDSCAFGASKGNVIVTCCPKKHAVCVLCLETYLSHQISCLRMSRVEQAKYEMDESMYIACPFHECDDYLCTPAQMFGELQLFSSRSPYRIKEGLVPAHQSDVSPSYTTTTNPLHGA